MIENTNRKFEIECMKHAMSRLSQLRGFKIDTSRSANNLLEERPDIILVSPNGTRIGVEHFLVDTCFDATTKDESTKYDSLNSIKYHSFSREPKDKKNKTKSKGCITNNIPNFSSNEFGESFIRICGKHMGNVRDYRVAKDGYGNSISKLGFLCEVRCYENDFYWKVLDNNKVHLQRINNIPLLTSIWEYIGSNLKLGVIDFFIITTISSTNPKITNSTYYDKHSKPKTYDAFWYV